VAHVKEKLLVVVNQELQWVQNPTANIS